MKKNSSDCDKRSWTRTITGSADTVSVDGYNVFGGRSKLAWFGQSNADVMMREMEMFDVMTANRDVKVWAVAKGSDHHVVDNNLPPPLEVKTNIPGKLEGGKHEYLDGKEAISKMKIAEGMQVNLFADEKMFPELIKPVQMAVDPNGVLYASVWPSYPHWNPQEPRKDRIIALHDDDQDGAADRCVIFADELNSVTGFEFWGGGMLVAALPELWFLKDTDGDGKADFKVRMLQGLSSADSHHSANAMLLGPDGWVYWSRGIFNVAAMETPDQNLSIDGKRRTSIQPTHLRNGVSLPDWSESARRCFRSVGLPICQRWNRRHRLLCQHRERRWS